MLLRQKAMLFWALLFPIILGLFFKLAFGNVGNTGKFEKIPVAVNEKLLEDKNFSSFINNMEEEDYFKVTKAADQKILDQDDKLVAYIESRDQIITRKSGIKETIVESIVNAYNRQESMVMRILKENPRADLARVLDVENHVKDISYKNMDPVNTYFYTLMGMQVIYGYIWGLYVVYQYEANLSITAKRNLVSPIKKRTGLAASILVAWIINLSISLFFLFYLKQILGVNFGGQLLPILGLIGLAALTGVSLGSFLGVCNKGNIEFKIGIGISATMLMSFLAGMMNAQMKVIIQKSAPIINRINPVALITDAAYSLYYYASMDRYYGNIACLSLVTLVLILATLLLMRGKQYDSL